MAIRYLVAGPPRSGSNWLCSLLELNGLLPETSDGNHERIRLVSGMTDPAFQRALDAAWAAGTVWYSGQMFSGFKMLTTAALDRNVTQMEERVGALLDGTILIRLQRRDYEAHRRSWAYAMATGRWTDNHPCLATNRMQEVVHFTRAMNDFRAIVETSEEAFWWGRTAHLHLTYEDAVANPARALDWIAKTIGVRNMPKQWRTDSPLRVQRDGPHYRELVAAYEANRAAARQA